MQIVKLCVIIVSVLDEYVFVESLTTALCC